MPYLLLSLIPQILSYLSLDSILNDKKTLGNSSLNHIEFYFVHINEAIKKKKRKKSNLKWHGISIIFRNPVPSP